MDDDRTRSLQSEATRLADAARDRAADTLEDVKVASGQIVDRVRELIEEGNVRRIALRKGDRVLFEIPLTVGVGAGAAALLTSPLLAAVGAVAALVSDITIAVERDDDAADAVAATASKAADAVAETASKAADAVKAEADKTAGKPADQGAKPSEPAADAAADAATGEPGGKTVGKPASDA